MEVRFVTAVTRGFFFSLVTIAASSLNFHGKQQGKNPLAPRVRASVLHCEIDNSVIRVQTPLFSAIRRLSWYYSPGGILPYKGFPSYQPNTREKRPLLEGNKPVDACFRNLKHNTRMQVIMTETTTIQTFLEALVKT